MNYREFKSTVEEAEQTLKYADKLVESLLPMMAKRLKTAKGWAAMEALAEMKKELKDFDSRAKQWKD